MNEPLLVLAMALQLVLALLGFLLSRRSPAWGRSLFITQVLVGAFFLVVVLTPQAQAQAEDPDSTRWLGLALFLGLLGLLKLLGRFEEPEN